MQLLAWIIFGLVVGLVAKFLTPGRDPSGFVLTALIGMGGSMLGGFVGQALGLYAPNQRVGGFFMSVLGAMVLLAIYHVAIARPRSSV